jgi:hypothetical protein
MGLTSQIIPIVKDLKGKFCERPFKSIAIKEDGSCWLCCSSWLPQQVGNLYDNTLEEIWHGEKAKQIRNSILDFSFKFCNHSVCNDIADNSLPERIGTPEADEYPSQIFFENDLSCNLSCPSCRTRKIYDTSGPEYERKKELHKKIINFIFDKPHDKEIVLEITGSGDPFGSKIFRDFLTTFDPTPWPNVILDLQTNGVLLTPTNWNRISKWHNKIRALRISFDAAKETTYNIVRVGGHWQTLLDNCDYINHQLENFPNIYVMTQFVVQDLNYKEMVDYANLILHRYPRFYSIGFQLAIDWNTWDAETYRQRTVWNSAHPEFKNFQEVLKDPIFKHKKVRLNNLASVIVQET